LACSNHVTAEQAEKLADYRLTRLVSRRVLRMAMLKNRKDGCRKNAIDHAGE
jgi:hypothetical protein